MQAPQPESFQKVSRIKTYGMELVHACLKTYISLKRHLPRIPSSVIDSLYMSIRFWIQMG